MTTEAEARRWIDDLVVGDRVWMGRWNKPQRKMVKVTEKLKLKLKAELVAKRRSSKAYAHGLEKFLKDWATLEDGTVILSQKYCDFHRKLEKSNDDYSR